MKIQKKLVFLTTILGSICLFSFSNKVNAMTISDDGKYALVLNIDEGEIDGEYSKIIKFNVEDGETTVKLSELTKGIVPFNGKNEFSHWGKNIFGDEASNEELSITDFNCTGESEGVNFTNGLVLWAKFSDKILKGTGTYYLTLDPFAGKIDGQSNIRLTSKSTEYKTVDLTKYTPVRDGYTFVGWALNGKFVTSIDSSYFAEKDAETVTATYTKNSFDGDYNVLILNANGGKIDGKDSNKYDYVCGANSGTLMSIFQYVPIRDGYTFNGWNTKKDGSGENYKYMYWSYWRNDEDYVSEFERDTLNESIEGMYKNITLYATWNKNKEINKVEIGPAKYDYHAGDKPEASAQPYGESMHQYDIEYEYWEEMETGANGETIPVKFWYSDKNKNNALSQDKKITTFEEGKTYMYSISLKARDEYTFADNCEVFVNSDQVNVQNVQKNASGLFITAIKTIKPTQPVQKPETPATKKYMVKFLNDDGTQIGEIQEIEEGKSAVAPTPPTKEGYTFKGWDKDFNNVTSNLEVKAIFEKNSDNIPEKPGDTPSKDENGKTEQTSDATNMTAIFTMITGLIGTIGTKKKRK